MSLIYILNKLCFLFIKISTNAILAYWSEINNPKNVILTYL